MGSKVKSWLQDCPHRVQQTLSTHRKSSYRENNNLQCQRCCTKTASWAMECGHNIWKNWKFLNHLANLPTITLNTTEIILPTTYLKNKKKICYSQKPPFFGLLCIRTLVDKDTPCHESVLSHPVLKAYPTHHSWIITAHISVENLDWQLCMFSLQKSLAHQLLVKLWDQPLASKLVVNVLMDKSANIDNIYKSYRPTIKAAVWLLKADLENMWSKRSLLPFLGYAFKWLTGTATTRDTWEIKQCVNQLIQAQSRQQETLVHVFSILNVTCYATQVNRQKLNETMDALQRSNEDWDRLFNITEVLKQHIRYQQMYIYM